MSRYTLAYVGFDAQQQESIAAVLYFAASALDDEWEAVAVAAESNISFINLDAENGEQLLQEQQQLKKDYCLVLVAEKIDECFEGYWSLEKKAQAPLSLRKLTELLNQVAACLTEISELPADEVDKITQKFLVQSQQSEQVQEIKVEAVTQDSPKEQPVKVEALVSPTAIPQQLADLDFSIEGELELDNIEPVESDSIDIDPINLPVVELETEIETETETQALFELDLLMGDLGFDDTESDSLQEQQQDTTEQQGNVFELDLDSVLAMTDSAKPNIKPKKEVAEFVAKVVDDLNYATVTKYQEVLPDVKIVLPTRTLLSKNYFFGILQLALKDKACRIIRLADLPLLYVVPDNKQFYFAGTDNQLMQFIVADPKQLKARTVKKLQLEKLLARLVNLHPQALDALFIRAVLDVSQGRLLKGHVATRKVELKANLAEIKIEKMTEYGDIAEFMQQQASDLFAAAESLQVPLATIFDFYNICFLLGYIHMLPEEVQQKVMPSNKKSKKTLGQFLKSFFKK
ncbi:MAG: hypothetical protein methR_P0773 [Methyloprofundus sp.]|nr:MAG: hypothetical protein methR_P0773 [Methyloprofundus sp.]